VLDDAAYRSFSSMAEYGNWCEKHLPAYLGYSFFSKRSITVPQRSQAKNNGLHISLLASRSVAGHHQKG
jgi:hypothetical protein